MILESIPILRITFPRRRPGPDLLEAVERDGILKPVRLEKRSRGRYFLVDGFARVLAAKGLGHSEVPAIVEN